MKRFITPLLALAFAAGAHAMTPAEFTQSVIDDMQKPDDGQQIGLDRGVYAMTQMGMMARGDYAPKFWRDAVTGPLAAQLKSSAWWTAITPWWNAVPLYGNAAPNAQLEVGTIATIGRKRGTNTWYTIFSAGADSGWAGLKDASGTYDRGVPVEKVGATPGYKSKIYTWTGGASGDNTLHGGSGVFPIDAQSLDGIINCIASRVVGPQAAQAKFAMWAGMDWYPTVSYRYGQNGNGPAWGPAVSASRLERIGTNWTVTCTAPLDPPGRGGGNDAHYPADKTGVFMSVAQLKANPAPEPAGLLPAGTQPPPVEPPVEPPTTGCTTCPAGPPGPVGPPGTLAPCLSTAIPAGISWHTVIATANTALAKCGR